MTDAPFDLFVPGVPGVVPKCEGVIYVDIRMPGRAAGSMMDGLWGIIVSR